MRLFYAVKFENHVKEALFNHLAEIQKYTSKGGFTDKNNFHITLVFVGECSPIQLDDLKKVVDNTITRLNPEPVNAVIEGLGTFARPGDELLWAGVKTDAEHTLRKINNAIVEELAYKEIYINDGNKKFTPHVTIARKVEFRENLHSSEILKKIEFEPIKFTIDSITLMESVQEIQMYGERRYTKIIYKPVYERKF